MHYKILCINFSLYKNQFEWYKIEQGPGYYAIGFHHYLCTWYKCFGFCVCIEMQVFPVFIEAPCH